MPLHIGFYQLAPTHRIYYALAERLTERHGPIRFTGVVNTFETARLLQKESSDRILNVDMARFIADGWDGWDISDENLSAIEERYGTPHLWYHINADRVVAEWPLPEIKRLVAGTAAFWEHYLHEHRPDVFICGGVAHLPTYLGYHVFQKAGVPFLTLSTAKFYGRFTIGSRVMPHWIDGLEEEYARIRREGLSVLEMAQAETYVREFRTRPRTPAGHTTTLQRRMSPPAVLRSRNYSEWLRRLLAARQDQDYRTAVRSGASEPYRATLQRHFVRSARWRLYQMWDLFEAVPEKKERYAYYALHQQPEATTLVNGQFWTNQLALVENIARSLPITHRLYVKEHRIYLGARPVEYLKRLKRIPNVRLISPFEDSHVLTANAELILTIAGTVGWEAILYEKPVVVFGDIFYQQFSKAQRVKDVERLPSVIHHLLREFQPDSQELLKFVAAAFNCSYPGFVWHGEPRSLESDNLDVVSDALFTWIQTMGLVKSAELPTRE